MEPLSKDLKILCNYRRMKEIKRCNNFPVLNREDVAQHSFYVAILAMAVVDEYNTYAEEHNLEYHPSDFDNLMELVNTEKLLRKALLHDAEESFTSDIPWNVKHSDLQTHEVIEKAIEKKINEAYEGSETMEIYHKLGKACKDGFEGQFVDVVDMLELAMYCFEEFVKGNHYIKPLLDKSVRLVKANKLYDILMKSSKLFSSMVSMLDCDRKEQLELCAEQLLDLN